MIEIIISNFESKFIDFDSLTFKINLVDDSSTKKNENAVNEKITKKKHCCE